MVDHRRPRFRRRGSLACRYNGWTGSRGRSWLTEPEHLDAADRVDRLTADYEMITSLARSRAGRCGR
jgi:hypothetical protein